LDIAVIVVMLMAWVSCDDEVNHGLSSRARCVAASIRGASAAAVIVHFFFVFNGFQTPCLAFQASGEEAARVAGKRERRFDSRSCFWRGNFNRFMLRWYIGCVV